MGSDGAGLSSAGLAGSVFGWQRRGEGLIIIIIRYPGLRILRYCTMSSPKKDKIIIVIVVKII